MKFSAALLAGGRSTRMTQDKAFLEWNGQPLWRVQIEKLIALKPDSLFIAARAEQEFQSHLSRQPVNAVVTCINDPADEDCGPIGAITRCLRAAEGPLLVLAVDMPEMTAAFLRDHLFPITDGTTGAVCRSKNGYEALAAIYVPAALPLLEAAVSSGRYALQPLLAELVSADLCAVMEVCGDDERLFANANTPEEAARLLRFQTSRVCA